MDLNFIFSQIFCSIALLFVCLGYFTKDKTKFFIFQIIANPFYGLSYIFLGSYVAGILSIISTLRCIYLFFCERYNFKYTVIFLFVFVFAYIAIDIVFWKNIYDIIPLLSSIMFTFGFYIKNIQIMRYFLCIPNALLIIYAILLNNYVSILLSIIELTVLIIAIIKYYLQNAKNQTPNETNQ
ncbi:MAG: YgjV family protein [Clostridia bacterium]|nr:YgjV family protein [Clostridia bacterium]